MGALSDYATSAMQDHTLRDEAMTSPAAVYLTWFTSPASPDGSAVEVTGGGFTRQAITFDPAADGTIVSDAPVVWTVFHSAAAQMVTGWGIYDAATSGNLLAFGRTPSMLIPMGLPFTVNAAAIAIASNDAAMSDYLADAWLDHLFTNTTYTAPSFTYLAHYTTTPTAASAGSEVSNGEYERKLADWTTATLGAAQLGTEVTWAPLADTEQTLTGFAVLDDDTGGNVLWFYAWPTPVESPANDTFVLTAGMITLKAA
jgi:hypothetical protein